MLVGIGGWVAVYCGNGNATGPLASHLVKGNSAQIMLMTPFFPFPFPPLPPQKRSADCPLANPELALLKPGVLVSFSLAGVV